MHLTGLIIVAAIVLLALFVGLWRRRVDGRVSHVADDRKDVRIPGAPSEPGPLVVQFTSEFCAACTGVRRVIDGVLADRSDAVCIELDVAEHPEVAARFNVMRTPTVLLLDSDRTPRFRVSGPVSKSDLAAALDSLAFVPQERP